jgi:tetratricopeptide (TPR) repeat protein
MTTLVARADADFSARRMRDAALGYRRALAVCPADVHALHRAALANVHLNDLDEAQRNIECAVLSAPERAELWEHAGLIAALKGERVRAEAFYHRAIGLNGDTATLRRNLADCVSLSGRLVEAKNHYAKAVELEPQLHHAIRAMARISSKLGQLEDAADYWIRAWTLDPSHPGDGIDLIAALAQVNRTASLDDAVAQIRSRFADNADALEALAFVLYKHERFADALNVARQGLAINPTCAALHHYVALALSVRGKITESLPHSVEAVRLMPDNPIMQYHLANVQLMCGVYKEGWARLKAFYALPGFKENLVVPAFPQWNGERVTGRQFLLVGEQGGGDQIQCMRFAHWLHRRGATVDLLVSYQVAPLAASMKGVRAVLTTMPPGPYDYWTHLLKMPEHMGLDLSTLPDVEIPYVFAPLERVQRWRHRIDAASNPIAPGSVHGRRARIGIVWAGNSTYIFDRYRSVSVDSLTTLLELPGVSWFALQKGEREHDAERLADALDIHTLGPEIDDFIDTLAILQTLDLVITVDTSVAHLAGAAGRPVWVLLPAYTEWRWLIDRTDTPWYPSMRLFRQQELGQWGPVIEEVRDALQEWRPAFR